MFHSTSIEVDFEGIAYCVKTNRDIDTMVHKFRKNTEVNRMVKYTTRNGKKMRRRARVWPNKKPVVYSKVLELAKAKAEMWALEREAE